MSKKGTKLCEKKEDKSYDKWENCKVKRKLVLEKQ